MPGNLFEAAALGFGSDTLWGQGIWLLGGFFYFSTGHVAKQLGHENKAAAN